MKKIGGERGSVLTKRTTITSDVRVFDITARHNTIAIYFVGGYPGQVHEVTLSLSLFLALRTHFRKRWLCSGSCLSFVVQRALVHILKKDMNEKEGVSSLSPICLCFPYALPFGASPAFAGLYLPTQSCIIITSTHRQCTNTLSPTHTHTHTHDNDTGNRCNFLCR